MVVRIHRWARQPVENRSCEWQNVCRNPDSIYNYVAEEVCDGGQNILTHKDNAEAALAMTAAFHLNERVNLS